MKIGIYITGLGQSFVNETVEKYSERLMNEMNFNTNGIEYEIKTEKLNYSADKESTVVSICEKNEQGNVVYKMYDFKYHKILTEKFNSYSLVLKNLWLMLLVIKKSPLLFKRLFSRRNYNQPFQTFYLFSIFFIIAFSVIIAIPALFEVMLNSKTIEAIWTVKKSFFDHDIPYVSKVCFQNLSESISPKIVSIIALLLLIVPNANVLITNLATEFVCANNYIEHGSQKQLVQGNLELLVDYITENEDNCKIHFHTYSFGSLLAIDFLFPFGNKVSKNTELSSEALITIGAPFEFVNSYYPEFYNNRKIELGDKIQWLNVYSIADALATNFRKDSKIGESEFGIEKSSTKPTNINYEVAVLKKMSFSNFFMLYSLKVHGMYWDSKSEGKSCLGLIYFEMHHRNLFSENQDTIIN